ncbi:MAG: methyl-accepting chemotaxis protein [Mariprofundales bacterium]
MKNLTIANKLQLIMLLVILGIAAVGAIHEWSLHRIDAIATQLKAGGSLMEVLDGTVGDMRHEFKLGRDYLVNRSKESYDPWKQSSDTVNSSLKTLVEKLPTADTRDNAAQTQTLMQKYDRLTFEQARALRDKTGFDETSGLQGKFRDLVHDVEGHLKRVHASDRLMVSMLMLRRHEKDFLLRVKPKYQKKLHVEADRFRQLLAVDPTLLAADKQELKVKIDRYVAGFDSLAVSDAELTAIEADMDTLETQLEATMVALDQAFSAYLDGLSAEASMVKGETPRYFWGAVIVTLFFLILLLWLTGRSIVQPITAVAEAMAQLIKGRIVKVEGTKIGQLGILLDALEKFQGDSREMFRLKRVVEQNPNAVMLANHTTLNITYINPSAERLFTSIESFLPCKANQLVGKNIDIFHKDPSHQRGILSKKEDFPMSSSFVAAGHDIAFTADALDDSDGNWDAIMVAWADVTEQKQVAVRFEEGVGGAIGKIVDNSASTMGEVDTLSAMAEETSAQADLVNESAGEANGNVMTVASAAEELSASIGEITRQVREAVGMSSDAVAQAERTNKTVTNLSTASEEIGEVIRVITDIAEQTNLLALNASIEAARAGDAGRGFAVVAGEVKELASQTGKATEQIARQIASIQSESQDAAKAIGIISDLIARMSEVNQAIAAAAEEQNTATQEIAQSVQYASDATNRTTEAIASVSEAAGEETRAVTNVLASTREIHDLAQDLQQSVADFLASLKK